MPTRPPRQKQYPDEGHLSLDRRGYPQSGLYHSTSVSAMNRALNTAAASGSMREIEEACDVIFIAGANTTESHPVFGALIKRSVARGAKLIVADVRKVELAELADIHLQMFPGSDVALFNTMLRHIIDVGLTDPKFIP